jgi:hypothetical protein
MTGWITDLFSYLPKLRLVICIVGANPFILCVKPYMFAWRRNCSGHRSLYELYIPSGFVEGDETKRVE